MIKERKNIPLIIGITLIFIGSLLPSIKIAQENISFLKENGPITIILVLIMFVLLKLDRKKLIIVPSIISLGITIKFIIDNKIRLKQINEMYNCYADFKYGLLIIITGNIILLLTIILTKINIKTLKEIIYKFVVKTKETTYKFITKIKSKNKKTINPSKIEKLNKKESKQKITSETSKDGKIKFNKIVVKVENKPKESIKEKLNLFVLKHKLKKISKKKISITKYKEEKTKKTYYIPVIDIKKWTRNDICCANCGATISTNSEYCFLCDCKIKLSEKEEKLS